MRTQWYELIMSDENSVAKPFFPSEHDFLSIDSEELARGTKIENWDPNSYLWSTSEEDDGELNDIVFATLDLIPTFSPRLREALAVADVGAKDVQYLPVRIFQSTGEEIQGFAVSNIIARVAALDRDRCILLNEMQTELDPLTGRPRISSIFNIAVRDEPLNGHDIVRLIEFPPAIVVSERFCEAFRGGNFTGAICSPMIMSGDD